MAIGNCQISSFSMFRRRGSGLLRAIPALLLVARFPLDLMAGMPVSALATPRAKPGVCHREASALGRRPATIGGKIRAPTQTRRAAPKYPPFPPGTTGRGIWIGEALVDSTGKVVRVWTIHEVEITPPLPAFNKAIVDAIRQWEFEPLRINKEPRPFCVTVTTNINWS